MMFDRLMDRSGLELTLRRIALGARLLGLGWLVLLASVTLTRTVPEPAWVIGPLAAAAFWALVSVLVGRRAPDAVTSRAAVAVDMALAAVALVAPEQAGLPAVGFYGGYPLIVVAVAAIRSRRSGVVSAVWLILVVLGGFRTRPEGLVPSLSQIILYLAAALIISWAVSTIRAYDNERRLAQEAAAAADADRARAEERAQMSRHLHDSVLQTLALIQTQATDPREVSALARRQERDLRDWLYGSPALSDGFAAALRRVCAIIEDDYGMAVEVVVVGDSPPGGAVDGIAAATREALVNAAKHAGCDSVSVFGEVSGGTLTVYVRDRGVGFSPDDVGADRHGIAESIVGRIERLGGSAEVRSRPGGGTEWILTV